MIQRSEIGVKPDGSWRVKGTAELAEGSKHSDRWHSVGHIYIHISSQTDRHMDN
jgi:hypothetical protein